MVYSFTQEQKAKSPVSTEVREHILDNGLTVWLNEDHNQPKVFGATVVKAGSKDSPNTGIAHYFEHIMFKGTEHIGTVDYTAEKVFLDQIADKYDLLSATKSEMRRAEIQREINELSILAADYVIPNEFDKLISKYGGTNLNAGTSYDYTIYHNTFSPQYIEHWAEINSERLICPVFRMFQPELETVYEEKSRRDDMMFNQAMEKAFELYFHPHPYAYPIIGSAESLKNPSLSGMHKFFKKYYVAKNMGLLLSGDFDTEKVLPIITKAFSRIPEGDDPERCIITIPPFFGRERHSVKIPIPLMKVMAMGFRGVPANHPDQAALNIAVAILNNPNGTGYLDRLMSQRKLTGAMAGGETLNEAGMLGLIIIPKLMTQTYKGAERLVWREINKVRNGDFSEEMFESLKQEQLRRHITELEDIDSRSRIMIRLFTQRKSWDDYRKELQRMEALTKDDVVRIVNKYLNNNYLFIHKKTGKYMKEYLPKPDFAPIVPKHSNATSKYARSLEKLPVQEVKIRHLDFERDVQTIPLTPKATLYVTNNPANTIFSLKISYGTGTLEEPLMKYLASYLSLLGTDKYTLNEHRTRLQLLGGLMHFDSDDNHFVISISGFDKYFEDTLIVMSDFLQHVKDDEKKLKTIVDDAKVSESAFFKSSNDVAEALFEYVLYGTKSQYMMKPSFKEIKKLKGRKLLDLFFKIRKVKCNFHYCGTGDAASIAEKIRRHIPLGDITEETHIPVYREPIIYDRPLVFFHDMRDVSQNIVYGFQVTSPLATPDDRCCARLFSEYFGGGMSSLLFQEIREFRSYAYQTSGGIQLSPFCMAHKPSTFVTYLSTQRDKTIDALTVLNTLVQRMPAHPEKIEPIIQSIINQINNEYPSFRDISIKIARYRQVGHNEDPTRFLLQKIKGMCIDDVIKFHDTYIKDRTLVYVIVGNASKINMSRLSSFGDVIHVRQSDFYN
ncbi:MAG: insulinase family protein [Tannerella sp.]|jgi:predicted Zn-dependent peptidase|nr:insulinase family protein [Tannerella sp.]